MARKDFADFVARGRKRSLQYEAYMGSAAWKCKRSWALVLAKHKCEECGSHENLQVHHLSYENLGNEYPIDLQVLCKDCHEAVHAA